MGGRYGTIGGSWWELVGGGGWWQKRWFSIIYFKGRIGVISFDHL